MSQRIAVLGAQWGDEGKGKMIDWLAAKSQAVVRFQGGHNAGHTLIVNDQKSILRLIPSGILHPHVHAYIGHGVVLSLDTLCEEITALRRQHVDIEGRLHISAGCHVLLPYHVQMDQARENALGGHAIGTTRRGIGPTYEDKVARRGIRLCDFQNEALLKQKLNHLTDYYAWMLQYYGQKPLWHVDQILIEQKRYWQKILPCVTDQMGELLHQHRLKEDRVLFEGAQGVMLDIDQGTYPFVTSSNTTVGAVMSGAAVGLDYVEEAWGIVKAYTTRVGHGPFPTELDNDIGRHISEKGHEKGSVTGRSRRCGWLDIVALRDAVRANGFSALCLTKLDVLDGLPTVKIATSYNTASCDRGSLLVPDYLELPGWTQSTAGLDVFEKLPSAAQHYIETIEHLLDIPIKIISTGAERHATMVRKAH